MLTEINLTTLDGSVLELHLDGDDMRSRVATDGGFVALEMDLEAPELGCSTLLALLDRCFSASPSSPWDLLAYEATSDNTPTLGGRILPSHVLAKRLRWSHRFWSGEMPTKKRRLGRKRQRRMADRAEPLPLQDEPLPLQDNASADSESQDDGSSSKSSSDAGSEVSLEPVPSSSGSDDFIEEPVNAEDLQEIIEPDPPPSEGNSSPRPSSSSSASSSSSSQSIIEDVPTAPVLAAGWQYVAVEGGFIVWGPDHKMNAHCSNLDHGRCHWDKLTSYGKTQSRELQGRPVGALALWLYCGECGNKADHQDLKRWVCSRATQPDRALHRQKVHDAGTRPVR